MAKLSIQIRDNESGKLEQFDTSGCILIYLEQENIRTHSNISIQTLAPILTRIALERLAK